VSICASKYNPVIKAFKVAISAPMRKLLTTLISMIKTNQLWKENLSQKTLENCHSRLSSSSSFNISLTYSYYWQLVPGDNFDVPFK